MFSSRSTRSRKPGCGTARIAPAPAKSVGFPLTPPVQGGQGTWLVDPIPQLPIYQTGAAGSTATATRQAAMAGALELRQSRPCGGVVDFLEWLGHLLHSTGQAVSVCESLGLRNQLFPLVHARERIAQAPS
jgi:hypothetical protein